MTREYLIRVMPKDSAPTITVAAITEDSEGIYVQIQVPEPSQENPGAETFRAWLGSVVDSARAFDTLSAAWKQGPDAYREKLIELFD